MKQALVYLRVSTTDQANHGTEPDGFSIPAQRRACQLRARSLDAKVLAEFLDRGETGRNSKRPGLQALLSALATEEVDYVIVHKLDRLARNRHDDVLISLALREAGVVLVSVTENVDDTPSGQLLHGILASINEFYSGNLAAEALKGATEKARQGGTPYRVPLGYLNVTRRYEDRELRTVEIDPERAPFIRWAFVAYATGEYSVRTLRNALMAKGLRPRRTGPESRPLGLSVLAKILSSRYYLGFVPYNGQEYPGLHPPLVSPATFAAVQLVTASKRQGERRHIHRHALKGTLRCARCSEFLGFGFSKKTYGYFFCLNRHGASHGCDLPYLPQALVEGAIVEAYRRVRLSPGQRRHLVAAIKREHSQSSRHEIEQRQAQDARRARLHREHAKLLHALYQELVDEQMFKAEQVRIASELADLERAESDLLRAEATRDLNEEHVLALAREANLAALYERASPEVQRFLTRAYFSRIDLDDLGTLKRTGKSLDHKIVVANAELLRTLNYQQLVYALVLLAGEKPGRGRGVIPAAKSARRTVAPSTPTSSPTATSERPAA